MRQRFKMPLCRQTLLLCLCICVRVAADETATTSPIDWSRLGIDVSRLDPIGLERYPEDVSRLLDRSDGFYNQVKLVTVYQHASASKTARDEMTNITWDFSGARRLLSDGEISWWIRGGRPVSGPADADLSKDIGSALDVNATREDQDVYLREFYWSQAPSDRLRYTLGWIDSSYRYDFNELANDDYLNFIAAPLVNSAAIPFPESGLAVDGLWEWEEGLDVHGGLYQANCEKGSLKCLDDLTSSEYFAPLEIRAERSLLAGEIGNYRLMGFYRESENRTGFGWSFSFDQTFGAVQAFLRGSFSDKEISDFETAWSLGASFSGPLGRPYDAIGLGWARGEPSDREKRSEEIFELFWRFQVTRVFSISPDIQWVVDPADNPEEDEVFLMGVRLLLSF